MLLPDKNEKLTCKVEGSVGTIITWYKDDQPLTSDEHYEPNGATLTLKNTYYKIHDGSYYCKANNTYGNSTSSSGIIRVYCNYLDFNLIHAFYIFRLDYWIVVAG